jgi:HAD superfamily hydrolase (TIGR01549 family)
MKRHKGIIFDLDMTIVDTSSLLKLRKNRQWRRVYANIKATNTYSGINELINSLANTYSIGIVTSSPRTYAEKIINYHNIKIPIVSAYHDTKHHKPHPEPIINGCKELGILPAETFSIGDNFNDIESSNIAGCTSIFATWGSQARDCSFADYLCSNVDDLKELL